MEGDIQDSTMLRDEMWFVVEKIKVGGVAGSGECVRGHNLDRFGYWGGLGGDKSLPPGPGGYVGLASKKDNCELLHALRHRGLGGFLRISLGFP